jgi:hypothetical protein
MKTLAFVATTILALGSTGCKHDNRRRAANDLKIRVKLSRGFVRSNADPKKIKISRLELGEIFTEPDDFLLDLSGAIICLVIIAPIVSGLEYAIKCSGTTKAYIWPIADRRYRQRLYWGNNKVYLPWGMTGKTVKIRIEFRGNYVGTFDFEADLTKGGKIKL